MSEKRTYKVLVRWQSYAETHVEASDVDEAERKALGYRLGRFAKAEPDTTSLEVIHAGEVK
tara:strand:- start:492 stop:674 length:183 start_codon:yes stop_codon:yes gene_type:complete